MKFEKYLTRKQIVGIICLLRKQDWKWLFQEFWSIVTVYCNWSNIFDHFRSFVTFLIFFSIICFSIIFTRPIGVMFQNSYFYIFNWNITKMNNYKIKFILKNWEIIFNSFSFTSSCQKLPSSSTEFFKLQNFQFSSFLFSSFLFFFWPLNNWIFDKVWKINLLWIGKLFRWKKVGENWKVIICLMTLLLIFWSFVKFFYWSADKFSFNSKPWGWVL